MRWSVFVIFSLAIAVLAVRAGGPASSEAEKLLYLAYCSPIVHDGAISAVK